MWQSALETDAENESIWGTWLKYLNPKSLAAEKTALGVDVIFYRLSIQIEVFGTWLISIFFFKFELNFWGETRLHSVMRTSISSTHGLELTDLGDVHDLDGRQLSRLDMSTLEKRREEKKHEETCNSSLPRSFTELCVYCSDKNRAVTGQLWHNETITTALFFFLVQFSSKKPEWDRCGGRANCW